MSACCPHGRPDAARPPPEAGDAIVVGAVGSAAPWFLTCWDHQVEVEFMIDTGCQVTILATTIFKRMCTVDPMVHSRLRPCRRRLISADSSPLTVKGELELNVVLSGLCCDMLFVVALFSELLCLSGTFYNFDRGIRSDCRSHVGGRFFRNS